MLINIFEIRHRNPQSQKVAALVFPVCCNRERGTRCKARPRVSLESLAKKSMEGAARSSNWKSERDEFNRS